MKRLVSFWRRVLDFFLPTSCSYCNAPVGDSAIPFFCSACWSDFTVMSGPLCPRCGRPFESSQALHYSPDHLCLACRQTPPAYDQALSVGLFEGPLREAVHQFKYRPCRSLGKPLADWLIGSILPPKDTDVVMPVPLHASRLRQRGFNQALLIAHGLADIFSIPLSYDNLLRIRPTRPQVHLTGADRVRNVAGAFAVARPREIEGKSILLVDDVFTTGATMNECALVLKRAGADRVTALTLSRAL